MKPTTLNEIIRSEMRPKAFPCPKCDRSFDGIQALRMHNIRVHTRAGKLGARKGSKTAAERRGKYLAYKREYNRKYRARLKEQEKNYPSRTAQYKRRAYLKVRDRYAAQGLNAHGQPYKRPRFEPLVYSPTAEAAQAVSPATLNYCPSCGEHLKKWTNQQ